MGTSQSGPGGPRRAVAPLLGAGPDCYNACEQAVDETGRTVGNGNRNELIPYPAFFNGPD